MKKARPVTTIVYQFANWRCVVNCYPQQRWIMEDKGDTVKLERNNVTLEIWKEDFEKHWKVIEEVEDESKEDN